MRWRPLFWLCVSMLCFMGAVYFWRLGDRWAAEKAAAPAPATNQAKPEAAKPLGGTRPEVMRLLSLAADLSERAAALTNKTHAAHFGRRLSNTDERIGQLVHNEHAILLENALVDTTKPTTLPIPDYLKSKDPGAYIVQSRRSLEEPGSAQALRAVLNSAGAAIVGYVPNNAYLVRASAEVAAQLQGNSSVVGAVLPFEPYYKLKPSLLGFAVEQRPLPDETLLNLLLFPDARETTLSQVQSLGALVIGEERSPFGPVLRVQPPPSALSALASLPGVHEIERYHSRILANDLSRMAVGVSSNSVTTNNYLDLSGRNLVVAIADTGVEATHPDLVNRVLPDQAGVSDVDTNGHGTFVAGIIAGDGTRSTDVTNASGSIMPGTNGQFRGKAPAAKLLSMELSRFDYYLQETAARTNALISNNSWTYGAAEYDLAAAGYDAAVRDSLPEVTGSQGLVYVFPAGNGGGANRWDSGANDGGTGGNGDTIQSPGTAKNVITVGAVEQLRNITNQTWVVQDFGGGPVYTTNQPWQGSTDSSNQIANFSSRGNVGINVEGDFGRFKPDVVAPGTFVLSTRSSQWDEAAYYNPTNYNYQFFQNLIVTSNSAYSSGTFVPDNAVAMVVSVAVISPVSVSNVALDVVAPDGTVTWGTNQIAIPPDAALSPVGDFWFFNITNTQAQQITFDLSVLLVTTNDHGNFLQVLSNLNNSLGNGPPYYYRYESGTSLSAGDASGVLALMQEFLEQRTQGFYGTNNPPSPALMKALLINGARSIGEAYDFQVQSLINYQGWGQINLPTSLPGALSNLTTLASGPSPMFIFDQSPTNALSTGQSHTRFITLSDAAQGQPLRITVVWTDPPGDPVVGVKLVNDLDLVVTNLDTGDVFFGNDILAGNDFNLAWNTSSVPKIDVVNNVENVYLKQPLGTNYSVTVIGHRVNVNAVTAHPSDVVQDYALVISSGDGSPPDALTLKSAQFQNVFVTTPNVFYVTNQFPNNPDDPISGGFLVHQRVGANTPLLGTNTVQITNDANAVLTTGMTNQWHFYVLSNQFSYSNASFITFLPPELAVPRMGATNLGDPLQATRPEADIDLYVSTDSGLTNLSTNAISAAFKSVGRGGTEFIYLSNAVAVAPSGVYYVGVKSEDQQAAEYEFLGVFSLLPPSTTDTNGNVYAHAWPMPAGIPVGVPPNPGGTNVVALVIQQVPIRRAIVTNEFIYSLPGNLVGTLGHDRKFVVLNNHTCGTDLTGNCLTNLHDMVYEDNGEGNVPFSRHSDGPGSLRDFNGEMSLGVWNFAMVNNFPTGTGYLNRLLIKLEKKNPDTNGVIVDIPPNSWYRSFVDVPGDATNLTICVSGNTQPLDLYVSRGTDPSLTSFDYHLTINPPGNCLSITVFDIPPLTAGTYHYGVYNPNATTQTSIHIVATVYRNPFAIAQSISGFAGPVTIADDAITYAYITNNTDLLISSLDVALLISDPRISDLAITLISPNGTRILLFEDRGALSTNGLGTFGAILGTTNLSAFYTNNFDDVATGPYTPGTTFDGWNVLSNYVLVYPELPAPWLSNNVLILANGAVSNTLPTTNSTSYTLTFEATHAPYLVGTVGWWPFDRSAADIFSGLDGLLLGDVSFSLNSGKVNQAFWGDGIATRMVVPQCPQLDVGLGKGFSVEGWIYPTSGDTNLALGPQVWYDSFETVPGGTLYAPTYFPPGWHLDTGTIDVMTTGQMGSPNAADTGVRYIDVNGWGPGTMSTNISLVPGKRYRLSLSFARNPDSRTIYGVVPVAAVSLGGSNLMTLAPNTINSWNFLGWQSTSVVFTATAPLSSLQFSGVNSQAAGVLIDTLAINQLLSPNETSPLVEWYDSSNPTNSSAQGVQFWLSGLPGTNSPGSLWANIWDTNQQPHIVSTPANQITNGGWQHVALTFDAASRAVRIYTNGQLAAVQVVALSAPPRTAGDLYFGYHPSASTNFVAYGGGLDEFGLYDRQLSDCEVAAIFAAGAAGKYGTNVLSCPVTNAVQLLTSFGPINTTFVNGLNWNNGPQWETNTIVFNNLLQSGFPGGPGTNVTPIWVSASDPNATVDNFVLSAVLTNYPNGLLHFNEDTNVSLVPIKFAPAPYAMSNFPPRLIFSNDFEFAARGEYPAGSTITGTPNDPAFGPRDWTVLSSSVTVLSNSLVDAVGTNTVALAGGVVQCTLPTIPGHRYQLGYTVRGPGAVSWWSGDVEPLSHRAWDLLGGNNGAFINLLTNVVSTTSSTPGFVGPHALYFNGQDEPAPDPDPGLDNDDPAGKLELGDPANLRMTNGFTIEGWIAPILQTNYFGTEQILFRGDTRDCLDPYYLALEPYTLLQRNLHFHIDGGAGGDCGFDLLTTNGPLFLGGGSNNGWYHVAAVFDKPFTNFTVITATNTITFVTNQLRIYLNGQCIASNYTSMSPFADLDPAYRPGVSLGNRSRYDFSQAFRGYMDEVTVYGRPLTGPEITNIYVLGTSGKADHAVPPDQSLAKVEVLLDDVQRDVGYGPNAQWASRTVVFTANQTNMVLKLQSLLPGTMVDGITLTDLPAELNYLPEESLAALNGESAKGVWKLEMWDTRAGGSPSNQLPALLNWQLNFILLPSNAPPVVHLVHGIPYTNTLQAFGYQNFVVDVPLWAADATNVLEFASDRFFVNPLPVGVLFSLTNQVPNDNTVAVFWPPIPNGTSTLDTNPAVLPHIVPGQPYYLTITNPNPVAVTFGYGVWFDILSLTNCQPLSNFVWQAGIPRYFQFDVPTNGSPLGAQEVSFLLTGVTNNFVGLRSNLTVVLSEHLPLPDLTHFDYLVRQPSTNDDVILVVTNTTPFPVQTNRWYVGVFNQAATNVPFIVEACYTASNYPVIIPLTNGVPFFAPLGSQFVAPPGPPQWVFFEFQVTNSVRGVLFELYDLSGDADLVLQRDVPPAMEPYLAGSFSPGLAPEQIVLRPGQEFPDLMGNWYLGVFNNESVDVAYRLRAVVPTNGLLLSAQPPQTTLTRMTPPHGLLFQWNSVIGEGYEVQHSTDLVNWQNISPFIRATTPLSTFEILPVPTSGAHFYRISQVSALLAPSPTLIIQVAPGNQLRISWSTNYPGETLQSSGAPQGPWQNVNLPVTIIGNEYVVFFPMGPSPIYFRLVP